MRRFVLLLWIILLASCSNIGMESRRDVVKNTFYASNPNLAVKLAEGFNYAGDERSKNYAAYKNHPGGSNMSIEHFRFVNQIDKRVFIITIKKFKKGYVIPNFNVGIPNPLETGEVVENGQKYHYVVFADKDDKGTCFLVKRLVRTSGGSGQMLLECFYAQALEPQLGDHSQWLNPYVLNEGQKNALGQFANDFKEDVQFVENKVPVQ